MKILTYQLDEEDQTKTLIFERILDENGNKIYHKDLNDHPTSECFSRYSPDGHLLEDIEKIDGVESHKELFTYDDEGRITKSQVFVAGELFQEELTTYAPDNEVLIKLQDGEEIFKREEIKNGAKTTYKFYNNGELTEVQQKTDDLIAAKHVTTIYDGEDQLIATQTDWYKPSNGDIYKTETLNPDGSLLYFLELEISNDLIAREIEKNYWNSNYAIEVLYTYDDRGNLTKRETTTLSGKLEEFYLAKYDDQDQCIEEKGMTNGNFNAIYGTHINQQKFHFIHEFKDEVLGF